MTPTIDEEGGDEEDDFADEEARPRRRRWLAAWAFGMIILVLVVVDAGYAGYQYTRGRYYVGAQGTEVVIYRGVNQNVAGLDLSKVFERAGSNVSDLPAYEQDAVRGTMERSRGKGAAPVGGEVTPSDSHWARSDAATA